MFSVGCVEIGWIKGSHHLQSPGLQALCVYWIPLGGDIDVIIVQSMTTEKMRGDRRHPWRPPVSTLKDGDNADWWMTWHLVFLYNPWIILTI